MRYRQMADFDITLAGGDIFQLPGFGSLSTTSSMWADKSYATTALTFCQRQSWHALLRSPYQVHLHQEISQTHRQAL